MKKLVVHWPDGTSTEARGATEAIVKIAALQPVPHGYQEMKDELSHRALVWPYGTGQFVEPSQPDEPFLRELHRVGLFDLEIDGEVLPR